MGLFSEASSKSQHDEFGGVSHEAHHADFGAFPGGSCDARIAPEIENSLDLVWGQLRSRAEFDTRTQGQVLALAHWEPREGATTLALALAFRAATMDPTCTFCIADFDVFQSGLSFMTALEAEPGVSNILLEQSGLEQCLCRTALPNLSILPAGYPAVGRQVTQLFDRSRELCELLAERFHYVVLDMPSMRQHPNFAAWGNGLVQAVLVVRAGQARRPAIAKSLRTLELMRLDVAGLLLNAREYHVPAWLYTRT
jgi:Mrp family chromosome partitioning ATPase